MFQTYKADQKRTNSGLRVGWAMAQHKGWRIRVKGPGQWLAIVRDRGRDRSRQFARSKGMTEAHAIAWAKDQAARVALGIRAEVVDSETPMMARPARTADLAKDYIETLEGRQRGLDHLAYVRRVLAQLAVVAPDLHAARCGIGIQDWLDQLTNQRHRAAKAASAGTRNKFLVIVRGFCRWAINAERLMKDPTKAIGKASVAEKLKPQLSVEELRACLGKTHLATWRGKRKGQQPPPDPYHLLFAFLLYTGMRFQEASHIRWQDIEWAGQVILVRLESGAKIKRNRERIVPIQPELRALLEPIKQTSGPLFAGREHNPRRGFQAFLERAKVTPSGRTPHSMRHSYAGLMAATGVPPHLLMAYLGHSNASTMMGYTKLAARYASAVTEWPRGVFRLL